MYAIRSYYGYGFNKAGDGLKTIKLLTLYSIENRQPIAFTKQPGNLPDVISVTNAIKQLSALGVRTTEIITDNGVITSYSIHYTKLYDITRAYLHLLGVGSLISFSREEYIQEGAKFMVEMADLAGRVSLPLLGTAVIFAAVWFLLRKIGSGRFMAKRGKWFLSQNDGFHWLWRASLFALLLFVLIYLAEKEVGYFAMPLAISDLLFAAKPVANGDAAQVAKWLVSGDRTSLDNLFFNLFLGVVKAGALLYFAWRTAGGWRLRVITSYSIHYTKLYDKIKHISD